MLILSHRMIIVSHDQMELGENSDSHMYIHVAIIICLYGCMMVTDLYTLWHRFFLFILFHLFNKILW